MNDEIISLGDLVKITLKETSELFEKYDKMPFVCLICSNLIFAKKNRITAEGIRVIIITSKNKEKELEFEAINLKDISKIELVKAAPESLVDVMKSTNDEEVFKICTRYYYLLSH